MGHTNSSSLKSDGSIHICRDYKLTVNKVSQPDIYPLPRIEELFTSLSGGKLFSKLDLANAYQQLLLDEHSKQYTTIEACIYITERLLLFLQHQRKFTAGTESRLH